VRSLLLLALAAGAVAVAVAMAPPAAADSHCPDPGGASDRLPGFDTPPADADWDVQGRGWGHGVGLSQYGARGAARLGCDAATILTTYFPGTRVTDLAQVGQQPDEVRVSLFPNGQAGHAETATVTARVGGGELDWQLPDAGQDGQGPETITQAEGATWRLRRENDRFVLRRRRSDGSFEDVWVADTVSEPVTLPLGGPSAAIAQLAEKPSRSFPRHGRPYAEGTLRFEPVSQQRFRVNATLVGRNGDSALDRYLLGLGEVPASWPVEALTAQAIAGRGYAARTIAGRQDTGAPQGCADCDLYDSPVDQVYLGAAKVLGPDGDAWRQAVLGSAGQVLADRDSDIAVTFYSSSHGGHSETAVFSGFFGESFDPHYLAPVDDSRWELASDNPNLAWSQAFSSAELVDAAEVAVAAAPSDDPFEADLPIGAPESVTVTVPAPAGAGGRVGDPRQVEPDSGQPYGGVRVASDQGYAVLSGKALLDALGVARRSERFDVVAVTDDDAGGDGGSDGDGDKDGSGDGSGGDGSSGEGSGDTGGGPAVTRLFGDGRITTAAAAAREGWPEGAQRAVLARAGAFADALTAGALAGVADAPLLLTPRGGLAPATAAVLDDLAVERVTVMGGDAAIDPAVTDHLAAEGYSVERVAGGTRFGTAAQAARAVDATAAGGVDEVVLALGTDWADALTAGALADGRPPVPTLLTLTGEIPAATRDALAALAPSRVTLVGGTGVIATSVADQLAAEGYRVTRLGGATRWDTSAAVAREALARRQRDTVVLASGQAFADALSGGALAATTDGVLTLVPAQDLGAAGAVATLLGDGPLTGGYLLGGSAAVSDGVYDAATALLDG
jgi:putative cell wall-binding protein